MTTWLLRRTVSSCRNDPLQLRDAHCSEDCPRCGQCAHLQMPEQGCQMSTTDDPPSSGAAAWWHRRHRPTAARRRRCEAPLPEPPPSARRCGAATARLRWRPCSPRPRPLDLQDLRADPLIFKTFKASVYQLHFSRRFTAAPQLVTHFKHTSCTQPQACGSRAGRDVS